MSGRLSIVIPALNEENRIGVAVSSAIEAGASEVIVSDGGSSDATVSVARERGAIVVSVPGPRGRQLNEGAARAEGDVLAFVHADTTLPRDAGAAIGEAMEEGVEFGGFRIGFVERSARLSIAAAMINLRTSLTKCPWGDQAQFIRRDVFEEVGRFREIPIMEDYELALRMKKRGRTKVLDARVLTSGRRFLEKGVLGTAFINWRIITAWHLGADPQELAVLYRGRG
ncbi:MAG: TIGR04283 family arsenosugar biosynthesis glycosyltransferase [Acidobacteria bacterium]|nr:TIGR04283 family arsenosugar biosynthesis glycosyltransferase [Acidobacteriota bacterium]